MSKPTIIRPSPCTVLCSARWSSASHLGKGQGFSTRLQGSLRHRKATSWVASKSSRRQFLPSVQVLDGYFDARCLLVIVLHFIQARNYLLVSQRAVGCHQAPFLDDRLQVIPIIAITGYANICLAIPSFQSRWTRHPWHV